MGGPMSTGSPMTVQRIDEGLWRWTAPHPGWRSPKGGWDPEVACVYLECPDAVVVIDPLVPAEPADRERFWRALDGDVARLGLPVLVVVSVRWHARSAAEVAARYPVARIWGPRPTRAPLAQGLHGIRIPAGREYAMWIPAHRTLVTADTLLGDGAGGLTMCPRSWLPAGRTLDQLRADLAPLLDLDVRRVLTSHGPPVLEGGAAALRSALG
ncbi:MAG: MBL fold metallo-hydrolase [Thermoleophilia bacterium]